MVDQILAALKEARSGLDALIENRATIARIDAAAELLSSCFRAEGHVFSCGNGGSMCDAMHFAEELSGRFRKDRPALGAIAISDPTHMSCVANDYGYQFVFSRFVEAQGRKGDVLLGISTSGKSANVLEAIKAARAKNMKVIALTGKPDSEIGRLADIDICTPCGQYADRVQELNIKVIHILIELIERRLFKPTK